MKTQPALRDVLALAAAAAAGILLTYALLTPSGKDVRDLAIYLAIGGGASLVATELLLRSRILARVLSLRAKVIVAAVFVLTVGVLNTFGLSALMFINSQHDLPMLVAILAFAGGISLYVAYRMAVRLSRNLDLLADGAKRLARGDLSSRVPVESSDEFGVVSAAFNDMASSVERAHEQQRQLEESRKQLTAAISHDLRTPLSSARAMLEAIKDGVVSAPAEQREYVRRSLNEINNLSELVDDLFELALIDAGAMRLERRLTPMQSLVLETVDGLAAAARSKGVELRVDVPDQMESVPIDGIRVRRVLVNLLQNAIRHTPPDGSVTVAARDEGSEVCVEVRDTGTGIPDTDLPHIWDRFFRADPSRTRDADGLLHSGLGLAIAKGIVDLHGGWIRATSENPRGTCFSFGIPRTQTPA
ncbi:MAG: HAMP domain-containing sensor histidine kinase [Chloroflexi bacterium]|nr:HAMP domain-containing sensor histidine kinase [Chloroflexota bacterium]